MRIGLCALAAVLLLPPTGSQAAYLPQSIAPELVRDELPGRGPGAGTRADTIGFGSYTLIGSEAYAVVGETWTFDHGAADPLEGWHNVPPFTSPQLFRRIDAAAWNGHGNGVSSPLIEGAGSIWIGAHEDEADARCWEGGLGYGNGWCQRITSPTLGYSGSGSVTISFRYWNDTEDPFDWTRVRMEFDANHSVKLNGPDGWTGQIGDPGTSNYPTFTGSVDESLFGSFTSFRIVFEFESDGGYSDEDGEFLTQRGAAGFDAVVASGSVVGGTQNYTFDAGLDGWSATSCDPLPDLFGLGHANDYAILDPCGCGISGNVLEFHDAAGHHPYGQHEVAVSPIVNRGSLGPSYNAIWAEWDMYAEMPRANGVFYRAGWYYFPFTCPQTGLQTWSNRSGAPSFHSTGSDPICFADRDGATDAGVPGDASLYRLALEVYVSCDAFGVPPTLCTGMTNFTPIFDNVSVKVTPRALAPALSFEVGATFIDGWGQGLYNSTTTGGNADIVYDLRRDNPGPDKLGDSLMVKGPVPTSSSKYEARMWWRIVREGPGAAGTFGYAPWKTAVADGRNIVGPNAQFTFGRMDSAQVGTTAYKDRFISEFREDDDDFAGEFTDGNEMIRDGILPPGTQIQYFITGNYTCTPTVNYYLPDTTGGNFAEFEILPSYRLVEGVAKIPALLYVNGEGGASRYFTEHALNVALTGAAPGSPIPSPAAWDRYDYDAGCSCFNGSMIRGTGGNNGATLPQLLAYRAIFVNLGRGGSFGLESTDYSGLSEWLSQTACDGNAHRQGLIVVGDYLQAGMSEGLTFFNGSLGCAPVCDGYDVAGCGPTPADLSRCVRIEDAPGGGYPSSLVAEGGPDYAYDAWGNHCPEGFQFSVLLPTNGGTGNRAYFDHDGSGLTTNYTQITKSVTGGADYRSVVDGVAWHHLSSRDLSQECVSDEGHIVSAMSNELRAALRWIYDGSIPTFGITNCPVAVEEAPGPRQSLEILSLAPNPLRTASTLRYALPSRGRVTISYIDSSGRRVGTAWSGEQEAGLHSLALTGVGDEKRRLAAGLYWIELRTDASTAVRKVIVIP